mmetsp:Transcript_20297/g.48343  ORF Transcript_20297/g.48343 Transcript_20297/m.48343 type:complete len:184 (+) Transcript_20297:103-654(+)
MLVEGEHKRTVWLAEDGEISAHAQIIDQRALPFQVEVETLLCFNDFCEAISGMHVRGAGCIGVTAGYGMYRAAVEASDKAAGDVKLFKECLGSFAAKLSGTRPTAANLRWAINRQLEALSTCSSVEEAVATSRSVARAIDDEDAEWCRRIGQHGLKLIRRISERKEAGEPVNILTHCNAGKCF